MANEYICGCNNGFRCPEACPRWDEVNRRYAEHNTNQRKWQEENPGTPVGVWMFGEEGRASWGRYRSAMAEYDKHFDAQVIEELS